MGTTVPSIDEQTFRKVMGHFPTGVVTVTATGTLGRAAMTLQSFQSLSLDPQLILVSVAKSSSSWPTIREIGSFAVAVLAEDQSHIARSFSRRGTDKFEGVDIEVSPVFGHPIPCGAIASMECVIRSIYDGGDHEIVVAEIQSLRLAADSTSPLVFFASQFSAVAQSELVA